MNVRGRDIPNQRQRRASKVVNGMAALEFAPHRKRFNIKNMTNTIPGSRKALIRTLVFQRNPPITEGERETGSKVRKREGKGKRKEV